MTNVIKNIVIIDGYTDEPAGLSVPPYLGTYQRYAFGACIINNILSNYITIDDLRFFYKYNLDKGELNPKIKGKTNTSITNLTKNHTEINKILKNADLIVVICGSHTPGKYLSSELGTKKEIFNFIKDINAIKILCGPAASEHDSTHEGGKVTKSTITKSKEFDFIVSGDIELFLDNYLNNIHEKKIEENKFNEKELRDYNQLKKFSSSSEKLIEQLQDKNIICEIELGRGCPRKKGCSFCTEWKRFKVTTWRDQEDILSEIKSLYDAGIKNFRLGRQSCFYSYKQNSAKEIEKLFKLIKKECPEIKVLHIDNANPQMVVTKDGEEITKLICKYCTNDNIAAFGVESFDPLVQEKNNLNCTNDVVMKAIEIINKYGAEDNKFLPGINLLFGLDGETKKTHEYNMEYLMKILEKFKIRRLNIRSVSPLPKTDLDSQCGSKFLHKNKKFYWKWRDEIRQTFDFPMLKKVYPKGSIITDVYIRMWDGNTSFGQQLGSYPIVCGVPNIRLEIGKAYDLEVIDHNLRSVVCNVKEN